MDKSKISLEPLEKATTSLAEALDQPKNPFIRDCVIQRFEYTYELSIRTMKRVLEQLPEGYGIDSLNYRDLVRYAAEVGVVDDPNQWFVFRDARNSTSHAYNEEVSEKVYSMAVQFLPKVKDLTSKLKQKI